MTHVWIRRVLATIVVAVALGPLIVGLAAALVILIIGSVAILTGETGSLTGSNTGLGVGAGALYYIYFSYYVGSPIALLAGLFVGATWVLWRAPNLVIVVVAAVSATAIWILVVGSHEQFDLLIVTPLAAFAAACCWLLSRTYVSRI